MSLSAPRPPPAPPPAPPSAPHPPTSPPAPPPTPRSALPSPASPPGDGCDHRLYIKIDDMKNSPLHLDFPRPSLFMSVVVPQTADNQLIKLLIYP